jgi:chorismate dehydratase
MPETLRVGLFPFLNVQPIIHGFRDDPDVEIVLDLPSRIADRFRRNELDLAMVPSFEAATLDAKVVNSACIASDGAVETVTLHHRVPLAEVKTLAVDEASRTSAALAKILIVDASGRLPLSAPFSPRGATPPEADAVVVIGDPAFHWASPGFARIDLGEEWKRRNGLPFVFAVMVSRRPLAIASLEDRVARAKRRGLEAASAIAASYNAGVDAARAEHYLRHVIRYDLGERERQGLALFHRQAEQRGLLVRAKELEFDAI